MNGDILKKYAHLLVHYCLDIKPNDRVYLQSSTLAIPLIKEVHKAILVAGASLDTQLEFEDQSFDFWENASDFAIDHISPLHKEAFDHYEAYLLIKAPFLESGNPSAHTAKSDRRAIATAPLQKKYFERIGTPSRDLKRNFCLYPTQASANLAKMDLDTYTNFVANACFLNTPDPVANWLNIRYMQQNIVDKLNLASRFRFLSSNTDIRFNCQGRTWINSDGLNNMPSGEVFTSPIEDSVEGFITFTFPGYYMGREVQNVRLEVKNGLIESWSADLGQDFLDYIFSLDGTRRFGEAAIGTNTNIQQMTGNILFDEKIGGTIHMAIGQSYAQCGGKNVSSVHWDMITDMTKDGQIFADDQLIYERGKFLI